MPELFVALRRFLPRPLRAGDLGATAVEYGLMVALIAAVIVGVVTLLGGNLTTLFSNVANAI
jgi:pilus assembly protein Flp/PilA